MHANIPNMLATFHSFKEKVLQGKVNAVTGQVNALSFLDGFSLIWLCCFFFFLCSCSVFFFFNLKIISLLKENEGNLKMHAFY